MCQNIKTLRNAGAPPAANDEVRAMALQFVRKISGYRSVSRVNADALQSAMDEIASASQRLLGPLARHEKQPSERSQVMGALG